MPHTSHELRDRQWIEHIRTGSHEAFEKLFRAYADSLCAFAAQHVGKKRVSEDIVQEVFCDLWNRRDEWYLQGTVKAYLYRAVRNTALDYLKRRRVEQEWEAEEKRRNRISEEGESVSALQYQQLKQAMEQAVEDLPERRRLVYQMARRHNMSYKEIAIALDIAPKTVENQMGRALKTLRDRLAKYTTFPQ